MAVYSMTDIPHFDLPFRFLSTGHAAVAEQDSEEDVINCVTAIARTTRGSREDLPSFGIDDQTFARIPLDTAAMLEQILEQEDRAHILIDQANDTHDQLSQIVRVNVSIRDRQQNEVL